MLSAPATLPRRGPQGKVPVRPRIPSLRAVTRNRERERKRERLGPKSDIRGGGRTPPWTPFRRAVLHCHTRKGGSVNAHI
jgi:hypothetical protein